MSVGAAHFVDECKGFRKAKISFIEISKRSFERKNQEINTPGHTRRSIMVLAAEGCLEPSAGESKRL